MNDIYNDRYNDEMMNGHCNSHIDHVTERLMYSKRKL